jgi:hypothetical protein
MTPTYVNMFLIYAMCNIHDVSWGNRETVMTAAETNREDDYKAYRTKWVLIWLLLNCSFGYFINRMEQEGDTIFMVIVAIAALCLLFLRFLGSMLYLCAECRKNCRKKRGKDDDVQSPENPEAAELNSGVEMVPAT